MQVTTKNKEALYTDFELDIPQPCKCVYELKKLDRHIKIFHSTLDGHFYAKNMYTQFAARILYSEDLAIFMSQDQAATALQVLRDWNSYLHGYQDTHSCLQKEVINKVVII